jgi:uncharacterized membrane protein YkoI
MTRLCLALFLSLTALPALAAEPDCLSVSERRTAIAEKRAMSLASITAQLHSNENVKGDLVGVRLCREDEVLVYRLTIVERGGKVLRAAVRAEDGALLTLR